MTALEMVLVGLAAALTAASFWFWIAMIVHCVQNTSPGTRDRYGWLLMVALGQLPGAIAYYLVKKRGLGGTPPHLRGPTTNA